jgi:hypothetical protein
MPPQSTYLIRPGTPADQLAEQRQAAIAMLNEASSTKPVQHWTQILGQMAKGGLSGYEIGEAQREGRRGQDEAGGLFAEAFASLGGSNRVPGAEVATRAPAAVAPSSPARSAAAAAGREGEMNSSAMDMDKIVNLLVQNESGGRNDAKNPLSSATGRGQFIDSTWRDMIKRNRPDLMQGRDDAQVLALRGDAKISDAMTGAYARENAGQLSASGLPVTPGSIRLAHLLGPGGARTVMSTRGNIPVSEVLPAQVLKANPFMQGMTASQLRGWADDQMRGASIGASSPPATGRGGPVSIAAPETDDERQNALIQKLYRNEQTRPIATALFSAKLAAGKDKKRHVVGPNASLVDDNGGLLYRGPEEDATAKARQQAIGKGQGEARLALPAAVSRAGETVGILEKLRAHPGLDAGTGATSLIASRVPGSDAYDFEQLRQQAQGTAFLTAIGEMRGTGAISNVEGEAATQAVGRMKGAQSKEAFLEALGDYERVVRTGVINTYRNAGLEIPPELMAARPAPGGAPSAAPGAPSSAPGSAAAARPASGAIKAPDGLQEGMTLRDTDSGELMTVRGGMLVPANAPAARAPAAGGPMSPARGAAAAGDMGSVPEFLGRRGNPGDYREDRLKLLDNPSGAAIQAFNQVWGPGMAEKAIQRQKPLLWGEGQTVPQGRYGYKLGQ